MPQPHRIHTDDCPHLHVPHNDRCSCAGWPDGDGGRIPRVRADQPRPPRRA